MPSIQKTRDYSKFKFIVANRDQSRGHVELLKTSFETWGNLTRVQPILVNDKFYIIDGQHRFVAAQELGQPVYYTKMSGLGINEARSMNILHRGWTTDDYAKSYALSGDKNYQKYLRIKEDYGFNHSITLSYIQDTIGKGGDFKLFREGEFVIANEEAALERLDKLAQTVEKAAIMSSKAFAIGLLKVMRSEDYNHSTMLKRLEKYGHKLYRIDAVEDTLRQLEELYNYNTSLAHRVRLY